MKKVFKLEGLCCANCAAKIENAVLKIEGVEKASLSFLTTKLIIDADEAEMPRIIKEATRLVKKYEPDVNMI